MNEIWIIAITILIVISLPIIKFLLQRKKAVNYVLEKSDEEKIKELNNALEAYGFFYDVNNDIISSLMNPWQRKMGYCRLYDELAPSLNMVIDSEPIYFYYDKRRWLIEFWKGQYGMTTGGEVGIYVTDKDDVDIPGVFSGPLFESVTDEELLNMSFDIKKDEKKLFRRDEYHWWLTGFDVGVFSQPRDLLMDIQLVFPKSKMKKAFLNGLRNAGYEDSDYKVVNKVVYINFDKPKSNQARENFKRALPFIQLTNKTYCSLYNWLTKDFERTLDKIYLLCVNYPILFKIIAGDKRAKRLEAAYEVIHSYLNREEIDNNGHT